MPETIAILGGGIQGMSAAHFLRKKGFKIIVLESNDRFGGCIQSEALNGYVCELGPNTVLLNNEALLELIDDLNLRKELISPNVEASKNRFVINNNQLTPVPVSPIGFITTPLLSFRSKLGLLKEPFIPRHKKEETPSIKDFTIKRFGKEFYDLFIVPFVTGIYAGDPEKMSVKHAFKLLYEAEQKAGSVTKGMIQYMKEAQRKQHKEKLPKQKMFTFKNGLQELVKRIAQEMGDVCIKNASVTGISKKENAYHISYTHRGEHKEIMADKVVSTLPAYVLSGLISDAKLQNLFNRIEYVPVVVFHFGFNTHQVKNQIPGFGALTPVKENKSFLGVLFNSRIFKHTAPEGKELFTVIIGGARSPEKTKLPIEELRELILSEISDLLQITGMPEFEHYTRYEKGIPQYDLEHENLLKEISEFEKQNPGFFIQGNYKDGVSVGDCVLNSKLLANKIGIE